LLIFFIEFAAVMLKISPSWAALLLAASLEDWSFLLPLPTNMAEFSDSQLCIKASIPVLPFVKV
jgi:hypothetical protein